MEDVKPGLFLRIFEFLFYHLCRTSTLFANRFYFPCPVERREIVPPNMPYILAPAGHRSYLDIFLVSVLTRRKLRYVGKRSLWDHRVGGWLLSRLGGFPMEREGLDFKSMRICIDILSRGEPLVIFPEGSRGSGPSIRPIFDGAAYLSIRTAVPIIPVGIWGAEAAMGRGARFPLPRRMHMIVGEPLHPPRIDHPERVPRDLMRALTEQLQKQLDSLFAEARIKATH